MLRKLLDSPWTYAVPALLLAIGAAVVFVEGGPPPSRSRPVGGIADLRALRDRDDTNVVFIVIDTLRADRLGSYGYERPTSRFMDGLAAGGIRFAAVEAGSTWTKASMASLWTGLDPVRTGVTRFNHALPEAAVLPAEIFREAGFSTVGIYRNGWVAGNFGFGQGFEAYLKPGLSQDPARFERHPGAQLVGTDEGVTRSAVAFLEASGHERFLLYLHYMDVHQYAFDGVAADQGFGNTYQDSYDAALHWVDRNVGVLLGTLDARGLLRKTVVVVTSDHGEGFGEHDEEGHAQSVYTEVTRVPWLISLPFRLASPVVVEPIVRNVDVWPTLLDLLGLPSLPETDGRSLMPEILAAFQGRVARDTPPAISFLDEKWGKPDDDPEPLVAVRDDGRSLIVKPRAEEPIVGAFDLSADPGELVNLAADGRPPPAWAAELEATARESVAQEPPWGPAPEVEIDALERAQLRALGYVIE